MTKIEESRVLHPYEHQQVLGCQNKGVATLHVNARVCVYRKSHFKIIHHSGLFSTSNSNTSAMYLIICLGCGRCWTFDGNWKLAFTHCIQYALVLRDSSTYYPDVCTEKPKHGKAFCHHHCDVTESNHIPYDLKENLKFKSGLCLCKLCLATCAKKMQIL